MKTARNYERTNDFLSRNKSVPSHKKGSPKKHLPEIAFGRRAQHKTYRFPKNQAMKKETQKDNSLNFWKGPGEQRLLNLFELVETYVNDQTINEIFRSTKASLKTQFTEVFDDVEAQHHLEYWILKSLFYSESRDFDTDSAIDKTVYRAFRQLRQGLEFLTTHQCSFDLNLFLKYSNRLLQFFTIAEEGVCKRKSKWLSSCMMHRKFLTDMINNAKGLLVNQLESGRGNLESPEINVFGDPKQPEPVKADIFDDKPVRGRPSVSSLARYHTSPKKHHSHEPRPSGPGRVSAGFKTVLTTDSPENDPEEEEPEEEPEKPEEPEEPEKPEKPEEPEEPEELEYERRGRMNCLRKEIESGSGNPRITPKYVSSSRHVTSFSPVSSSSKSLGRTFEKTYIVSPESSLERPRDRSLERSLKKSFERSLERSLGRGTKRKSMQNTHSDDDTHHETGFKISYHVCHVCHDEWHSIRCRTPPPSPSLDYRKKLPTTKVDILEVRHQLEVYNRRSVGYNEESFRDLTSRLYGRRETPHKLDSLPETRFSRRYDDEESRRISQSSSVERGERIRKKRKELDDLDTVLHVPTLIDLARRKLSDIQEVTNVSSPSAKEKNDEKFEQQRKDTYSTKSHHLEQTLNEILKTEYKPSGLSNQPMKTSLAKTGLFSSSVQRSNAIRDNLQKYTFVGNEDVEKLDRELRKSRDEGGSRDRLHSITKSHEVFDNINSLVEEECSFYETRYDRRLPQPNLFESKRDSLSRFSEKRSTSEDTSYRKNHLINSGPLKIPNQGFDVSVISNVKPSVVLKNQEKSFFRENEKKLENKYVTFKETEESKDSLFKRSELPKSRPKLVRSDPTTTIEITDLVSKTENVEASDSRKTQNLVDASARKNSVNAKKDTEKPGFLENLAKTVDEGSDRKIISRYNSSKSLGDQNKSLDEFDNILTKATEEDAQEVKMYQSRLNKTRRSLSRGNRRLEAHKLHQSPRPKLPKDKSPKSPKRKSPKQKSVKRELTMESRFGRTEDSVQSWKVKTRENIEETKDLSDSQKALRSATRRYEDIVNGRKDYHGMDQEVIKSSVLLARGEGGYDRSRYQVKPILAEPKEEEEKPRRPKRVIDYLSLTKEPGTITRFMENVSTYSGKRVETPVFSKLPKSESSKSVGPTRVTLTEQSEQLKRETIFDSEEKRGKKSIFDADEDDLRFISVPKTMAEAERLHKKRSMDESKSSPQSAAESPLRKPTYSSRKLSTEERDIARFCIHSPLR